MVTIGSIPISDTRVETDEANEKCTAGAQVERKRIRSGEQVLLQEWYPGSTTTNTMSYLDLRSAQNSLMKGKGQLCKI
jgi:hypothetical protein